VFAHLAHYVVERMQKSGVSLPQFEASGFDLSLIGINKRTALQELQPRIPKAHLWYSDHGDSVRVYLSWALFWPVMHNRLVYFFRKHHPDGGALIRCIAEWPGTVSKDGQRLIPPAIPPCPGYGITPVQQAAANPDPAPPPNAQGVPLSSVFSNSDKEGAA